ncbi:urease accessory protein UreE [Orrella marina]|uniref:Urease accessory protein UreE n=1 Tax=Orrella marina TaxID=2163011 RepID=A0A2R4XIR4_9BURK|nr:urease accessory protein UreE [Orrella marina]AWB33619.1 urease accessory protein UreE [Orrella marina]
MTIRFETCVAASGMASGPGGGRSGKTTLAAVINQMAVQKLALTSHQRNRSRLACLLPDGQGAAIILPARQSMHPGDRLLSACGCHCVEIVAANEPLLRIEADSPFALMRVVYHLANRHVPAMLLPEAVLIEPDTVLADLVLRLGARVNRVEAPFVPESGAYAGSHEHGSGHAHLHLHVDGRQGANHGHHQRDDDPMDAEMGHVGEMLSRQAHEARQARS